MQKADRIRQTMNVIREETARVLEREDYEMGFVGTSITMALAWVLSGGDNRDLAQFHREEMLNYFPPRRGEVHGQHK